MVRLNNLDDFLLLVQVILPIIVIMSLGFCMYYGIGVFDDSPITYTNTTEHILDKQIIKEDAFMDHQLHYYIFTDNYCFDMSLGDYNKLNVGEDVIICKGDNGAYGVTGYFKHGVSYSSYGD